MGDFVIIGASSDIGLATIQCLLSTPNTSIFAHFRSKSAALELLAQKNASRLHLHQANLESESEVEKLAAAIIARGVPRGFLHLAAPPLRLRRFKDIPREELKESFAIQTLSSLKLLQALLPPMAKAKTKAAVILLLSEVVGGATPKGFTDYVISKFAQLGLLRALEAEYANSEIRFHGPSPGMMNTKFIRELPELAVDAARQLSPGKTLRDPRSLAEELANLLVNVA